MRLASPLLTYQIVSTHGEAENRSDKSLRLWEWNARFLNGGPVGCGGGAIPTGWMNPDNFYFIKHFQKTVHYTRESPIVLILDNHWSHRSFEVLKFSTENAEMTFSPQSEPA